MSSQRIREQGLYIALLQSGYVLPKATITGDQSMLASDNYCPSLRQTFNQHIKLCSFTCMTITVAYVEIVIVVMVIVVMVILKQLLVYLYRNTV